ncbi:acyl-CoA dehydrogenase family protein [Arthrobacter sp. zg-Y179]|uniref:acyl-CoA dehydrogenase family protein n=1 Tax=Arthrobacter sp. zg-Y179 TaxID=2894188 RepID=UPI001E4B9FB9|nr:acyl-CoA dehydrogenase family protein [Arthrobacter sp. zg-Y179]MCC9173682.1 acyl-CoA dehydrogenase family protein [Arthrobacter sp. zg-Y179]
MTDTIPQPPDELSPGLPPGPPPERSTPLDAPASRYLSAEGKRLAAGVRALQNRIRELAPEAERRGRLSPEIVEAFTELGLYRACAPIEYGGSALGARDIAEIARALGRGDAAANWTFFVGTSLRMVSTFPKPLVDELYSRQQGHVGPLAAGGSTFAAVTGKAVRVEGGWNVEGKWTYVSGNHDAAWLFGGAAWTDGNRSGHALFMMDPADIEPVDDWHVAGMMASDSNSITTTKPMFVPDHRFIDMSELPMHLDSAAERFTGLAYQAKTRASMMTATVLNMAALVGMAEGALEVFQELAQKRKPFSPPYDTIAEMASSQVAAGKAKALLGVAGATVLQYADEIDHLAVRGEDYTGDEEAQGCTDLAFAGQLAKDAIDLLLRILGSSGMALSNPLQRYSRDSGVILSHGAMRLESLAEISGRRLLGQPPFKMFAGGLQDKGAQK